jgi:alpha-glucosidase
MLELYRVALALRKAEPGLGDGPMTWLPGGDGVLAFDRGGVRCVVNISADAVRLPEHAGLLLASGPLDGGLLPPDSAVWLRAGGSGAY